ncbi:hypothetical protein D1AOALGA4SA_8364 [Olavius algarvensis Delta 1 endosymbiont]|nr:hypothetical protein D1AOALGA4SA_8364 [Olavius algarvensis Delta 1 endosymbiont]
MNNLRHSNVVSRALIDILAYLADHPDADDTIEGIAQWWLLEQRIRQQIPVVEKALAVLVEKGFVLKQSGSNGRTRFRINRRKRKEIETYLEQWQRGGTNSSNNWQI